MASTVSRSPRKKLQNQFSGGGHGACLNITLPWWSGRPCVTV